MQVACARCGAAGGVDLGAVPGPEVACSRCGARFPRGDVELDRLKAQFLAARARAAEAEAAEARARAADEAAAITARCPECGDDLFTVEFGCPKCGAGRKPFLARNPGVLAAAGFVLPFALGVGALAAFGSAPRSGPIANLGFILGGSVMIGLGVRVMTKPGNFVMVKSHGTDSFGQPIYGSSHVATPEEGLRFGAVFVVGGLVVIALGVFFGLLAA